MGNFINSIQNEFSTSVKIKNSQLLGLSLSKIIEYYSIYKHISSSFLLNFTEFEQIFGELNEEFDLWDDMSHKRIDSFEIFTGITLFSNGKPDEKFSFLFSLFDHNTINTLSLYDLIHLFDTAIQSCLKIFRISNKKIVLSDEDLNELVSQYVFETTRIEKNEFKRILLEDKSIKDFMELFEIETYDDIEKMQINENTWVVSKKEYESIKENPIISEANTKNQNSFYKRGFINYSSKYKTYRKYLYKKLELLTNDRKIIDDSSLLDYNLTYEWIYGISYLNIKHPIKYLISSEIDFNKYSIGNDYLNENIISTSSDAFFYIVGKVVVIYFYKKNKQKYYLNHENEVISICSSLNNQQLCASGESCLLPLIHIWSQSTLDTIKIIKGSHQIGIHLLSFSFNTNYIISIGQKEMSPLIIYNRENEDIALSHLMTFTAQDISIYNYKQHKNEVIEYSSLVVVVSTEEIILLKISNEYINLIELSLDKDLITSEICSCCIIPLHSDDEFYEETTKFLILVGLINGRLVSFSEERSSQFKGKLIKEYKFAIISICLFNQGIAISQPNGKINIWDESVNNELYDIDISLYISLFTYKIISISSNNKGDSLLIIYLSGEIIEIRPNDEPIYVNKINKIIPIGLINDISITSEKTPHLIYGSYENLHIIDTDLNEEVYMINLNSNITTIDSVILRTSEIVISVGCVNGCIFILRNWEEFPLKIELFEKSISKVKFSFDDMQLIVSFENSLCFLYKNKNSYLLSKRFDLKEAIPTSFSFNNIYTLLIVFTNKYNFFLINMKDLTIIENQLTNEEKEMSKKEKKINFLNSNINNQYFNINNKAVDEILTLISSTQWQSFQLKLSTLPGDTTDNYYISSFSHSSKFIVSTFDNGSLIFFKDIESVSNNQGNMVNMHSSLIKSIQISSDDKHLYTSSYSNTINTSNNKALINGIVVKHRIIRIDNENTIEKRENTKKINEYLRLELKYSEYNEKLEYSNTSFPLEIQNELNSILELNSYDKYIGLKDKNLIIKGFLSKIPNLIFSNKRNSDEKYLSNQYYGNHPQAFLDLTYIYGSHICQKRNSVMYLHYNKSQDGVIQSSKEMVDKQGRINKNTNFYQIHQEELLKNIVNTDYQQKSLSQMIKEVSFISIRNEISHPNCERHIIYYISRIIILLDPIKKTQRFYQRHISKVSCISIDSYNNIIASGECAAFPTIHIWNPVLETIKILPTSHLSSSIHILKFSPKGKYLVSIDNSFSIEVYLNFTSIIYKPNASSPIFNICFITSSFDEMNKGSGICKESTFVTVGYCTIIIWEIHGNILFKKKQVDESNKIFTCVDHLDYINTKFNSETDLLIGSDEGDISVITCGVYMMVKSNVHKGSINIIIVTDLIIENKYSIITAGEDGFIKIFDQMFNLLSLIQPISQLESMNKSLFSSAFHKGIISLDINACDPTHLNFLIGFRCGDLLEMKFNNKKDICQYRAEELNENVDILSDEHFAYNYLYSYPSISYSTDYIDQIEIFQNSNFLFVINKSIPMMIISSPDTTLRLYDITINALIFTKHMEMKVESLSISNDNKILFVGFSKGIVHLLDLLTTSSSQSSFNLPSLLPIQIINMCLDEEVYPFQIKSSLEDDFLVVGLNRRSKSSVVLFGISVFKLRMSQKMPFRVNVLEKNYHDLYIKLYDIDIPDGQFKLNNLNKSECQLSNIDFSDDGKYLLICLSQISNFSNENSDEGYNSHLRSQCFYIIWDIIDSQLLLDPDKISNLMFSSFSSAQNINAKEISHLFSSYKSIISNISVYSKGKDKENVYEDDDMIYDLNVKDNERNNNKIKDLVNNQSSNNKYENSNLTYMISHPIYKNILISGNANGFIHIFNKDALQIDSNQLSLFDFSSSKEIGYSLDYIIKRLKASCFMSVARTFSGFTSKITYIDYSLYGNYIYASSLVDNSVFQYQLQEEDLFSDLDFFKLKLVKDPFLDVMSKIEYQLSTEEYWPLRDGIKDEIFQKNPKRDEKNQKSIGENKIELQLTYILGRKSVNMRNNLKYDSNNRLTYTSSSYVLFLKYVSLSSNENKKFLFKQNHFLPIESICNQVQMEISCFDISDDKKEIAIGNNGNYATISVWEINTESIKMSLTIREASVISILKFSNDKESLICTGLHKLYFTIIFLIDIKTSQIYASKIILNSLPFKIKAISFFNYSKNNFITAGIQHFALWKVRGSNLECSHIPIPNNSQSFYSEDNYNNNNNDNDNIKVNNFNHILNNETEPNQIDENKLSSNNKYGICLLEKKEEIFSYAVSLGYSQDHEILDEKIKISFLDIALFDNSIVLSSDSGFLYVFSFDTKFFTFKSKPHSSPIMSMDYSQKSYLLLTGSMDGTAVLHGVIMNNNKIISSINRLVEYNTYFDNNILYKERLVNPNYNIQSVSIGVNKVCIGTRSGNIFEFIISSDMKIIRNREVLNEEDLESHGLQYKNNDEYLINIANDSNNRKSKNLFETYIKFQDHDVPISIDFDMYSTRVFTLTKEGNFRVISLSDFQVQFEFDFKDKAIQSYHFKSYNIIILIFEFQILAIDTSIDKSTQFTYKRLSNYEKQIGQIQEVKVSPNEKLLAVSVIMNSNPYIYMYDILNGFVSKNIIENFNSYIRTIDFSVDSNYLIIEDNIGRTVHYEIQTKKEITLDELNFEIEWMNDGLKYSEHFKHCLPSTYGNDLVKISKISKHPNGRIVAVGDYTGVLRFFNYPAEEYDTFFEYRTDHIAKITHIVWSNDQKLLGTVSENDRSVFIYKILYRK